MTAVNKPLYIEQGATFTLGFNWYRQGAVVEGVVTPGDPYDLTGCSARMQVRRRQGEPALVTATSLPTGDGAGRIFLGGATGRIEITLTDEDTDLIDAKTAVYDLEIEWPLPTRVETVAVTTGSTTITTTGVFTSSDVSFLIEGAGIPAGTVIVSVESDTSATMSQAATADDPAVPATITSPLRPRVDRLLQGSVEVSPNITQVQPDDPVVTA